MRARLLAMLSAVLVAVLWVSPQTVAYLCSMYGESWAKCCCPPDDELADPAGDAVERTPCCQVQQRQANVSPALVTQSDEGDALAAAAACFVLEGDAMTWVTDVVPALARGPPPSTGPPPYLRNRRFLI